MDSVYKKLAEHLDKLPSGFPPTESGIELKILKKLFTVDEAEIATGLQMMPESAHTIARRLKIDEEKLDVMSKKGLIFRASKDGKNYYMAAQFVIGIWEYHLNSLDEELIGYVNQYFPHFMEKSWNKHKTKQLRVIPVSEKINAEIKTINYDVAEEIIARQSKIVVSDCICRKEHKITGKECDYPMEVCLSFGSGAHYYEQNGLGRSVDKAEALEILGKGREAGLVLQPGNSKKPYNICMCCGCCCQVLSNLKKCEKPVEFVHSNYYAQVDPDECIACEVCIERCHMDAIIMEETALVNTDRCIGCGVCVPKCPTDAMILIKKEESRLYEPPESTFETYMAMAEERGLLK